MNTRTLESGRSGSFLASRHVLAVFLVLLVLAPLVLPDFYVTLLNYVGLSSLVALGLVLLTGVEIDSRRERRFSRVTDVTISTGHKAREEKA